MIKNGERKLAYITVIDEIKPIPNADKIELARVGGWQVVVSKADNYKVGDKVITSNVQKIREGVPVVPIDPNAKQQAPESK